MGPFNLNNTHSNDDGHSVEKPFHQKDCGCCGCHNFHKKCKDDCLCHLLQEFLGEEVMITTKTGDLITGQLKKVKGCCVKILTPGSMTSVPIPGRLTFIRCQDIESFSVNLPTPW